MSEDAVAADPEVKKGAYPYHLFQVYGVELEYMIVNRHSLDVMPITDQLMRAVTGEFVSDWEKDPISWSNELALHVLEFKTTEPTKQLNGVEQAFQKEVVEANGRLEAFDACLMPSAMHPWMNPNHEMRLWPHEHNFVYEAFNNIFDCRGHGWANLQSTHINLPFSNDAEFARLHAAIRLVLPILPGIAASSPIADGVPTGYKDTRLKVYRGNSKKIPSVNGDIIPEVVSSQEAYEEQILQRMYREIAPHDPKKILQHEWLNARGAIARFNRGSIEIRLIDIQESPKADLAIVYAVTQVVQELAEERWVSIDQLNMLHEKLLKKILDRASAEAEEAIIEEPDYLQALGWQGAVPCRMKDLWHHLISTCCRKPGMEQHDATLQKILKEGTLATRILRALGAHSREKQAQEKVYRQLCQALQEGKLFIP